MKNSIMNVEEVLRSCVLGVVMWLAGTVSASADCIADRIAASSELCKRIEMVGTSAPFSIFETELTGRQRELLEFLYAYMPLPDLADYPGEFYKANVDLSLLARQEMPWGGSVPDREFRHFVLPVRVNNENLDMSRCYFYEALRDRVRNLSMHDAVLEVNHWCHEHVTYQPSDARTSSPMATLRSAIGRCGEESTFTVAALRSVGIPARQVYTPRWAHTDDNHAWVEAWVDGQWHFLGACEPEAVLDLGWFNAPAARGMLMNTKLFGSYDGPEQQLAAAPCYTEINVTENYTPVDTLFVEVRDMDGNPVGGARVDYMVYNYNEYYPVATLEADSAGGSWLVAGLGDMLVWGSHQGRFGFEKATPGKDRRIVLELSKGALTREVADMDVVPPSPSANMPSVPEELARINGIRLAQEDSIRHAYEATFPTPSQARGFARRIGADEDAVERLLTRSRGNHAVISAFLQSTPEALLPKAMALLDVISDKDCRDIAAGVLSDHLDTPEVDSPLFNKYVLNPRVADEMLTPYKSFFREVVSEARRVVYASNPDVWVDSVASMIAIDDEWNPRRVVMSPESVWRLRKTDSRSRNIFFVAGARAMGIPARIDPVTDKPQYATAEGIWVDAVFDEASAGQLCASRPSGLLRLTFSQTGRIDNPAYYYNFTLSKIENGVPELLNYPEDATWADTFKNGTEVEEGKYMLTTGQRMADGTVLARCRIFDVESGRECVVPLEIRQDTTGVQVIGTFNSENLYHDFASGTDRSVLSATGRGYYTLMMIAPNHEPTVHALNDLVLRREELERSGRPIVLLFADMESAGRFDKDRFKGLPSTVVFGADIDGRICRELSENLKISPTGSVPDSRMWPLTVVADTFNRVVFNNNGYSIGLGDRLVDVLHEIK